MLSFLTFPLRRSERKVNRFEREQPEVDLVGGDLEKVERERVMSRDKADRMMSKRKERESVCVREKVSAE